MRLRLCASPAPFQVALVPFVALALATTSSCNQSALPPDGSTSMDLRAADSSVGPPADLAGLDLSGAIADQSVPADLLTPPPPDLAGFCGDPKAPRITLDGMTALTPAVSGAALALNCCDAATIDFVSMQIAQPISVMWRHQVGQGPNPPVTLDLANLPAGWGVTLMSGCGFGQPNCTPTDQVATGLTGTLTVAGNFGAYEMTACIDYVDNTKTHPVLKEVHLWSGKVLAK